MKKRILIINHYATPPKYGGLNRHHYLVKYLTEQGYDVKIVSASAIHNSDVNFIESKSKLKYKNNVIDGVSYMHVKTCQYEGNKLKRLLNIIQFYFRTLKILKQLDKPDYIYTSSPHPLNSILGIRLSKKYNVQHIAEIRDLWPASFEAFGIISHKNIIYKLMYLLEKKIYFQSDKIIFTFNNGIQYLKEQKYVNKLDLSKVYYLNNGVDLKEYNKNFKENKIIDVDLENGKNFNIVYAGSLRHAYNLMQLVDIAQIIEDRGYENIKILIYGKGPIQEELSKMIKEHKLNNIILKGYVEHKYLPYILSKCHLALHQIQSSSISKYGSSGNKIFLYMAAGLPIISTFNEKQELSIIVQNNCGYVLDSDDNEKYIDKIMFFYNLSKKQKNNYYNNCKSCVLRFDYKNLSKELIKIMED